MNNGAIVGLLLWAIWQAYNYVTTTMDIEKENQDPLLRAMGRHYEISINWFQVMCTLLVFTALGQLIGSFF